MRTFPSVSRAVCVLLLWPVLAGAQSKYLQTQEEVRKAAEGVVASVAAGNTGGAWKELKPLSVVPPSEFEVFEAQFNSQLGGILQRYGSASGYELLREEPLGKSLIRYTFVVKHEKAPMRWLLVFYRTEKGWVATDFKFDGNILALFPGGG
jgi:hypothetical protein